jgi:putative ABC transport system permease protein
MDLMPILSTLRRHKTAASLIVIEIALTSAIVCNALHLIATRLAVINHDSGLPESELVVVPVRSTGGTADPDALTTQDLAALRALPGVKSATVVNQIIYGGSNNHSDVRALADGDSPRVGAAFYAAGDQSVATLGLKLVAGRDFKPEEFQLSSVVDNQEDPNVGQIIVNRALADKFYPGGDAVGQPLYVFGEQPVTIVGVVESLTHPSPNRSKRDHGYAALVPVRPSFRGGPYVIRTAPDQREAVLKAAVSALERNDPSRIVNDGKLLTDSRAEYYAQDRSMAWLMGGVIVALMVVTAFGIVGLASFWVQQRTRMIGTRRAMGATRGQILRYFQLENFLLSSLGIAIGMLAAYGMSLVLAASHGLPRLPVAYLPIGALALWGLGQLAVLAPARRAAALPPVAALRS